MSGSISNQSSDRCKNKLVDQISKGDKDEVASKNESKMMIKQLIQEEMETSRRELEKIRGNMREKAVKREWTKKL